MVSIITFSTFCDAFRDMNRNDNFSYEGKRALFDYLELIENECDMNIELDIIAICCEYSEYSDLEEIRNDYPDVESIDDLHNQTTVIEFKTGIIIGAY